MFSGIVQGVGKISDIESKKDHITIEVSASEKFKLNLKRGASISVNGVCLTSLCEGENNLKFDVIAETLSRTNLGSLMKGSEVNLERSINASSEIGGHLMSGHVHFCSQVISIIKKENTKDISISFPNKYKKYIFEKGYLGVNGCSLTIGATNDETFIVHLIPETLEITNLDNLEIGDSVNIEIDQNTITIVKTVENILATQKS